MPVLFSLATREPLIRCESDLFPWIQVDCGQLNIDMREPVGVRTTSSAIQEHTICINK
jgi:hypothetical protein